MSLPMKTGPTASKMDHTRLNSALSWTPDYRDAAALSTSSHSESMVIKVKAAWPSALGLNNTPDMSVESRRTEGEPFVSRHAGQTNTDLHLHDLLDIRSARLIRGYIRIGPAIAEAHDLSCALAADAQIFFDNFSSRSADRGRADDAREVQALARKFWRGSTRLGPFEYIVTVGFLFENLLLNYLDLIPASARPRWNRHRAVCGRELLYFLLDQDPSNAPIVQKWLDRAAVHCSPLFKHARETLSVKTLTSPHQTYAQSRNPLTVVFSSLERYGIRTSNLFM